MPFVKGRSGNPKGCPPGKPDWRGRYREMIEAETPDLLARAIEMAKEGDSAMMRLLLDKVIPAAKDERLRLPQQQGNSLQQADQILSEVHSENLAPSEGKAVLDLLRARTRIQETEEILARLEAIEERLDAERAA